jgi:hypothetical protein
MGRKGNTTANMPTWLVTTGEFAEKAKARRSTITDMVGCQNGTATSKSKRYEKHVLDALPGFIKNKEWGADIPNPEYYSALAEDVDTWLRKWGDWETFAKHHNIKVVVNSKRDKAARRQILEEIRQRQELTVIPVEPTPEPEPEIDASQLVARFRDLEARVRKLEQSQGQRRSEPAVVMVLRPHEV